MGVEGGGVFSGGWSTAAAKPCDSCRSGAAAVFCSGDSAFLCLSCDAKIHCGDNKLAPPSRHERVWMCEVCQQAPAAVTCKADAASLCVACDADIHSAHPLAQRHERVPVEPFFDSTESMIKSAAALNFIVPACNNNGISDYNVDGSNSKAAQWLLMNSNLSNSKMMEDQDPDVNFSEIDPFLDFEYQYGIDVKFHQQHNENERVVPAPAMDYATENCFDMDFSTTTLTSFSYPTPTQSLSQSVSSTSVDFRVVPDGSGNSMSDMTSYSFEKNVNDVVPNVPTTSTTVSNQAAQFCGMDREARVLRYREKRKNRKFEKTIRYASRKAYAETRPRIKGRFAKRKEIETELDDFVSSVPDLHSVLSPVNYFLPCGMI